MLLDGSNEDHIRDHSLSFLCAATSAMLMSLGRVRSELWFLSLFALVPFLWRLCHVSPKGAIALGMMLGSFYVCATSVSDLVYSPGLFFIKLLSFKAVLGLFGFVVSGARKRLGFDPVLIALLWFPTEYLLTRYAHLGTIFSISNAGPGLVIGFCSLFGILLVSLVTALWNSLLLAFIRHVGRIVVSRKRCHTPTQQKTHSLSEEAWTETYSCSFPNVRAPPRIASRRQDCCNLTLRFLKPVTVNMVIS